MKEFDRLGGRNCGVFGAVSTRESRERGGTATFVGYPEISERWNIRGTSSNWKASWADRWLGSDGTRKSCLGTEANARLGTVRPHPNSSLGRIESFLGSSGDPILDVLDSVAASLSVLR